MTSKTMYMTQRQWNILNKRLSIKFNIDYTPTEYTPPDIVDLTCNRDPNQIAKLNMKSWTITHIPTNNTFTIENLSQFCRDNGLVENKMRAVAKKQKNSHRGYKVLDNGSIHGIMVP